MFKAIITEDTTEIQGTTSEILTGLICYIQALRKNSTPEILIKKSIEIGFKDKKELENTVKRILKNVYV